MAAKPVRSMGDDTTAGQIRRLEPQRYRRPGKDTPAGGNGNLKQGLQPIGNRHMNGKRRVIEYGKRKTVKRRITPQTNHPTQQRRFYRADFAFQAAAFDEVTKGENSRIDQQKQRQQVGIYRLESKLQLRRQMPLMRGILNRPANQIRYEEYFYRQGQKSQSCRADAGACRHGVGLVIAIPPKDEHLAQTGRVFIGLKRRLPSFEEKG